MDASLPWETTKTGRLQREIDASPQIVAPGFIDLARTHSDFQAPSEPAGRVQGPPFRGTT